MKTLIVFFCLIILLVGCKQQVDLMKEMQGTYSMEEQSIQRGEQTTSLKSLSQLKMYTGTHFMYTQLNPQDSTASFGLGSFTATGDTLIEHSIYSSADSAFNDTPNDFKLVISKTPKGYKQIINHIEIGGVDATLTEFYTKVTDTTTMPLDGVWKETKSFLVTNGDTTANNRTQYKAFFRGYFMFGNTVNLASGKTVTGMGYGSFKKTGPSQFDETDLSSSYETVAGNTFPVAYELTDDNHFVQTVTNKDNSIGIEYYERLQ